MQNRPDAGDTLCRNALLDMYREGWVFGCILRVCVCGSFLLFCCYFYRKKPSLF